MSPLHPRESKEARERRLKREAAARAKAALKTPSGQEPTTGRNSRRLHLETEEAEFGPRRSR
jgi:hypothetical protein